MYTFCRIFCIFTYPYLQYYYLSLKYTESNYDDEYEYIVIKIGKVYVLIIVKIL